MNGRSKAIRHSKRFYRFDPDDEHGGTFYAFSVPSGHYKIGITSQGYQSRLSACQTGNHERISVEWAIAVPADLMTEAEQCAHTMLAPYRTCGEWFKCPEDMVHRALFAAYAKILVPMVFERWARMCRRPSFLAIWAPVIVARLSARSAVISAGLLDD